MAFHPEIMTITDRQRQDPRSPLMQAKARALKGEKVIACPYGCGVQQVDPNGYCHHLVGFTIDPSNKEFTPMFKTKDGRRVVRPKKREINQIPEEYRDAEYTPEYEQVLEPVLPTDILVQITTCSRVYRDITAKKNNPPAKAS